MTIEIRRIGVEQAPIVQSILESSPEYYRRTDRSEVKPHFAVREITDCVPRERQSSSYEKVFCLVSLDQEPIGIVDLHKNHKLIGQCYLGLFLLHGAFQGRGLGRLIFEHVESFVRQSLQCQEILLGVSKENDVEGFWLKMGFVRNGNNYVWKSEGFENSVFEMSRNLNENF